MGASFFAGGNTCAGFVSRFSDVLPLADRKRVFYIKGGPGLGKSFLMKAVLSELEASGARAERFYCSGDPASLDAVSFPEYGAMLMDGTSPHSYDPELVGARDTLVSLGDALDERALRTHGDEIASLQSSVSECYRRCYAYLAAASSVASAAHGDTAEETVAARLAQSVCDRWIDKREGQGDMRRLFACAYTCRGVISLYSSLDNETTVCVPAPPMRCADALLRQLSRQALLLGHRCIALCHPLWAERVEGLYLPDSKLLFTPERVRGAEIVDTTELFPGDAAGERERGFDKNAFELIEQRAVEQLKKAKALHDELEAHYVKHMDFSTHDGWREKIVAQIKECQ